ncbi:MAG: TlpA disulfide reductase family protein [Halieaceae bacterium]|jgi:peroxiredoxin|nr:TlpA disulfide reductase family protein [Halieaceae bacterium]
MTGSAEARVGERAPDFVLEDASGELVSLKDFHGKPLVLHFWARWCPYCEKLQPGLQALADARAGQGLVLLGISFREDERVAPQAVLASRGLRFKTLVDGDEVADMYGVRGTPTTVFIARDGRVVGMTHSSDPADAVLTRLADKIAQ